MVKRLSSLRTLVTLLSILTTLGASAQSVTGQVTSLDDGEPLIGATVQVKGTSNGVITNIEGNYTISASATEVLLFSFLGFEATEILVGTQTSINVALKSDALLMDEVVVVAYGTVRKSDLTGAISSVKADQIISVPAASAVQALQGKVPGVRVVSNSGTPGEAPTVRIRGVGSFNDASPIFVVDGLILQDITFLNPSDIQSMEVLKDASATALYGVRGANGVILVTTKSGSNSAARISITGEAGIQHIPKFIDMLEARQFAEALNQIQPGSFNNLNLLENTDWQKEVYRSYAPMYNAQASVSGGHEKMGYYVGTGFFKQEGIIPNSGFQKVSVRVNNYYKPAKGIKLGHNINFTNFHQDLAPNVVASTLRAWPTDPAYNDDGSFFGNRGNGNPLASIEYNNSFRKGLRLVGNFYAEVSFLKNFTIRSSYGIDNEYARNQSFSPVFFVTPQQQNTVSRLNKGQNRTENWLWEHTLNYNKTFGKHRVDMLFGYTAQEDNSEGLGVSAENLIRDFITYLPGNLEDINSVNNGASVESRASYLFRANYVAFDKYLFTFSMRRDGSSRFSKANRWGTFPAVAVGWNLSEEGFFQSLKSTIPYLKFRTSYGILGNDKVNTNSRFTLVNNGAGAVFGVEEVLNNGATYGTSGNPGVGWEEVKQLNSGLEMALVEDKLVVELDYYRRVTEGILVPLQLPGIFGNGSNASTFFNAADVLNTGIEFNLTWSSTVNEVGYSIGINGATVKNETLVVTEETGNTDFISRGSLGNGQNVSRIEKGFPVGYFYGYKVAGVFQNEAELAQLPSLSTQRVGDLRFEDTNDDGVITLDDRTFIGSPIPDLVYGMNLGLSYKGFELGIDIQGELGQEIYNGKNAVRAGQYNYEATVLNAWDGEGSSNTDPRLTAAGVNFSASDWFIQDGSYLRLRTLNIGYNLPPNIASKLYMQAAKVYLRGTNVFTLTKYNGYTPEIGGGIGSNGIDTGLYPITSVYTMGMNLTF